MGKFDNKDTGICHDINFSAEITTTDSTRDGRIGTGTGATPAKNTANAAGALRNALTACNTLVYTWPV